MAADYSILTKENRDSFLQQTNNRWKEYIAQIKAGNDLRWLYVSDSFIDYISHLTILDGQWFENPTKVENPYYEVYTTHYGLGIGIGKIYGKWSKNIYISKNSNLRPTELEEQLLTEIMEDLKLKEVLMQLGGESY